MLQKMTDNMFDLDMDTKIYRVFPLVRVLDLFEKSENVLVRPKLWDDPFENFFLGARVFSGVQEVDISDISKSWYGQCWTTVAESDAMWRIYSPNKDGVCVGTTVGKLFGSFYDKDATISTLENFIGRVEYKAQNDIASIAKNFSFSDLSHGGGNIQFARSLLLKREEFRHEHEVRILFCDTRKKYLGSDIVPFNFNAADLIDSVVFDPRLDRRIVHALSVTITSLGYNKDIERSRLYDAPQLVINLE
ncbi:MULTISPECIES: DUF2971 domain-containing protein [Acetobacter]|uniref:DUF2971 domain-containing protein n=3 Tax=Acetobacter TaxID=434 RepID=A0AAN1PGI7_9PROT|nr:MULTISPECIES: DUF2971 domain-containing protein [Acetobacter]KAA8419423.1 DUF2971 domain-containing protein [Acetobacter sp. DmW_125130]ASL40921.1 hypothetical protein CBI36_11215 [Acetobacter oryzifermentans]AXM99701.1 DUF2971 domain-containing protein [Acetobacter pomorum]KAA8391832.1 DUF2971 domain-containing protein [Acetobacter sp. DmW_125124]KAA8393605.1 DUF2971 domain-containing protein [Acetobacter sp. DmW_125127]